MPAKIAAPASAHRRTTPELTATSRFLARERDHPTPYTVGLNRYAEVKAPPKTLGAEFVDDLLEVTGGGKARDFLATRDHDAERLG